MRLRPAGALADAQVGFKQEFTQAVSSAAMGSGCHVFGAWDRSRIGAGDGRGDARGRIGISGNVSVPYIASTSTRMSLRFPSSSAATA